MDPLDTKMSYNNSYLKRYYKPIVLRQFRSEVKKRFQIQSLIIGIGGLGCPLLIFGQLWSGTIGIVDNDKLNSPI